MGGISLLVRMDVKTNLSKLTVEVRTTSMVGRTIVQGGVIGVRLPEHWSSTFTGRTKMDVAAVEGRCHIKV